MRLRKTNKKAKRWAAYWEPVRKYYPEFNWRELRHHLRNNSWIPRYRSRRPKIADELPRPF